MLGVNKVILLGRAVADAELKQTKTGVSVTTASLATNRMWKSPDGQKQQEVEYHNLTFFGKSADYATKITKGMKVYIEGRLKTDKWEDQQGNKKSRVHIIVEKFEMIFDQPVEKSNDQVQDVIDILG